jgi:hypothetical protein
MNLSNKTNIVENIFLFIIFLLLIILIIIIATKNEAQQTSPVSQNNPWPIVQNNPITVAQNNPLPIVQNKPITVAQNNPLPIVQNNTTTVSPTLFVQNNPTTVSQNNPTTVSPTLFVQNNPTTVSPTLFVQNNPTTFFPTTVSQNNPTTFFPTTVSQNIPTTVSQNKPYITTPYKTTKPPSTVVFRKLLSMTNDQISNTAYTNGKNALKQYTEINPTINVFVGPHTQPFLKDVNGVLMNNNDFVDKIKLLIRQLCTLYSSFSLPSTFNYVIYNFQDAQWAAENYYIPYFFLGNRDWYRGDPAGCMSEQTCGGAQSTICIGPSGSFESFTCISLSNRSYEDAYFQSGGIILHETTHPSNTWQFNIPKNKSLKPYQINNIKNEMTNGWYNEAHPQISAALVVPKTYTEYLTYRNLQVKGHPFLHDDKQTLFDYSIDSITNVLNIEGAHPENNPSYSMGYSMGMLAMEALVAIGGVDSTMQLFVNEADGLSFADSFQMIYGIPWSEAAPILAQIVQRQWCSIPDPIPGTRGIPPICANITTPFAS